LGCLDIIVHDIIVYFGASNFYCSFKLCKFREKTKAERYCSFKLSLSAGRLVETRLNNPTARQGPRFTFTDVFAQAASSILSTHGLSYHGTGEKVAARDGTARSAGVAELVFTWPLRENDGCDRVRPSGATRCCGRSVARLYRRQPAGCRRRRHVARAMVACSYSTTSLKAKR
jgi:hypothetical protein